jgi:hypothetical protein
MRILSRQRRSSTGSRNDRLGPNSLDALPLDATQLRHDRGVKRPRLQKFVRCFRVRRDLDCVAGLHQKSCHGGTQCGQSNFQNRNRASLVHRLALFYRDSHNHALSFRDDRDFHLHRFDQNECVAFGDLLTCRDFHLPYKPADFRSSLEFRHFVPFPGSCTVD